MFDNIDFADLNISSDIDNDIDSDKFEFSNNDEVINTDIVRDLSTLNVDELPDYVIVDNEKINLQDIIDQITKIDLTDEDTDTDHIHLVINPVVHGNLLNFLKELAAKQQSRFKDVASKCIQYAGSELHKATSRGSYTLKDFLKAIEFATYHRCYGDTKLDSYKLTFPERLIGKTDEQVKYNAISYSKNASVTSVLEKLDIPFHLMYSEEIANVLNVNYEIIKNIDVRRPSVAQIASMKLFLEHTAMKPEFADSIKSKPKGRNRLGRNAKKLHDKMKTVSVIDAKPSDIIDSVNKS